MPIAVRDDLVATTTKFRCRRGIHYSRAIQQSERMGMRRCRFTRLNFRLSHRTTGSDQQTEANEILHYQPQRGEVPKKAIFRRGQPFTPE